MNSRGDSLTAGVKLENIKFAFSLMQLMEIGTSGYNAGDFVKKDVKGVLRCVYGLFEKATVMYH